MMDKLLYFVGMGNWNKKYVLTRHNIGMDFITKLESEDFFISESSINTKNYNLIKFIYNTVNFYTIKLKTYMNLSGPALKILCDKENVNINQICVVVDDFNLQFGKFRIRLKGSAGSHKGLQSIIDTFATTNFARIRIGIGPPYGIAEDFVLQKFNEEELQQLPLIYENFISIVKTILEYGFETAMNNFNRQTK